MAKLKTKAREPVYVPASRDECAQAIRTIGDVQREVTRLTTKMNDRLAVITGEYQPELEQRKLRLQALQDGVQAWCEANRAALTNGLKVKSANLVTGEVGWRQRPPSALVRGMRDVVDALKRRGLHRFIRTSEEVNKEAVLNDPEGVRGVAGITVQTGVEDFYINPFEQEAA